jgi:uncharacterized ubiquitin-like protein YukD
MKLLESVVPELHELVTHEIVHYLQDESGLRISKKNTKKTISNIIHKTHEIRSTNQKVLKPRVKQQKLKSEK